jgi:hypothetical protein
MIPLTAPATNDRVPHPSPVLGEEWDPQNPLVARCTSAGRATVRERRSSLASLVLLMLCVMSVAGCHSPFVEVTIVNQGPVLHVLEFDYPSASFGANLLDSGASYHYRFKIQGSGPLSLQYQDASGQTHTSEGPKVDLGEEGTLLVNIDSRGAVTWTPTLINRK